MLGTAVSLALIATPITAAIAGVTAWLLFDDFDLKEGLLVGRGPREHGRRGDLRAAAQLDAATEAGARARGRVGPQRPGRRPARARADRVHQHARLRPRRRAAAARPPARHRARGRRAGRLARRAGVPARAARDRGPVPGRVAGDRRARVRRRRHAARLGLPRRLPRRARARLGRDPRPADDHRVPPGPRVGRPGRDVPHARPARLPAPAGRDRGSRARCSRSSPRRSRGRWRSSRPRCSRSSASASGSCSAGPACAARSRSCSRRSR